VGDAAAHDDGLRGGKLSEIGPGIGGVHDGVGGFTGAVFDHTIASALSPKDSLTLVLHMAQAVPT
jgi:hypothetical protein